MKHAIILLTLLTLSACKITISPMLMGASNRDRTKTIQGVEMSTRIITGKSHRQQQLVAPILRKRLDAQTWMEYRLQAHKSVSRPFAPDLVLEITTTGPWTGDFFSARDHMGNQLTLLETTAKKDGKTTKRVKVALTPKMILKNNNQDYTVFLRGKTPGQASRTYEINLPAYYHRGFMNRYKIY